MWAALFLCAEKKGFPFLSLYLSFLLPCPDDRAAGCQRRTHEGTVLLFLCVVSVVVLHQDARRRAKAKGNNEIG